jgi:hypothetical protein
MKLLPVFFALAFSAQAQVSVPDGKAKLGELHYGPLVGGTIGTLGERFAVQGLTGIRVEGIRVNLTPERNLVKGFQFFFRRGTRADTLTVGSTDGVWEPTFSLRPDQSVVGVAGAGGWYLDRIEFLLSDGTQTPNYGGRGGDVDFRLSVHRRADGSYASELRGFWGTRHEGRLETLGLLHMPLE